MGKLHTGSSRVKTSTQKALQINLWNFGYANMDKMYEDGFDLINCNDGNYYIVPNAGYYYDYLTGQHDVQSGNQLRSAA